MEREVYWLSDSPDAKKSEDESSSDDNRVEIEQNRIYFYSEVERHKNLELNKSIQSLSSKLINRGKMLEADPGRIFLHINSYGGSVFAGLSSVDYIMNSPVPVTTVIDGCAASAATLMSVVGHKRLMHKHSYMLIHQLSSGTWGKYEEIKDEMKNCDNLMKVIKDIYETHTKIPKKELTKLLKRDLWWNAETCLKYGLIDEII